MRLKVYRAAAVAEAMRQVRSEMGPDALILSTRKVADGVEVTACLEAIAPPPQQVPDAARVRLLAWHGLPRELCDQLGVGPLAGALATAIRFTRLDIAAAGQPLLFAGPPGAGKTLTVIRLAARLVMAGRAPQIICADSQRAGATEQVQCLARVLGVPVCMVDGAVEVARAAARRRGAAPVLIDTAGIDLFNHDEREGITHMAAAADAAVVAVLPAGIDPFESADLASALVSAGATALAVTRLDTARRLGAAITASRAGLALAEAGISPAAADGLTPLTPAFLAERLSRQPAPIHVATGERLP
jgi:flagellar biosynthesis protein FlhF